MKDKEKEKRKLKKSAASAKPQKPAKKQPSEDSDESPELEIEPEEPDEDEEAPEELEPDEDAEEDAEGAEPASKNGKAGARPKGRPSKRPLIVDDEFEEDGVPDADEVGEDIIIIPRKPKSKRASEDGADAAGSKNGDDPNKPQTRLGLIRSRHDAMRREIDQIREDLESEEEE